MPIKDPAAFIQRIPELEALAEEPRIRRAIETGDPFKVYRALAWAKWLKRLPAHQQTLKTLVRNRRLFAKTLNGAPSLATINSVGFSFVGRSEKETDGTYIAMHAFVVLYLIPIVPLRSYLVKKVDASLFSSRWSIFARVPPSLFGWLYARGLALGLVALVGWGAVGSIIKSRTQDVDIVNGFDLPVSVELDGTRTTIAPMGRETVKVKVGDVRGSASAKGLVVDTFRQHVTSSSWHSFWNIAGAAPLYQERVAYSSSQAAGAQASDAPTVYCGQQFVEIPHADDVFSAPPQSVRMSSNVGHVYRSHVDLAPADKQPGYLTCLYYLSAHEQAKQAMPFVEAEAKLNDWNGDIASMVMFAASFAAPGEAVRIARQALAAHPDDVLMHRRYQAVRDDAGEDQALLQEYADRARKQPDSAAAQYLYASLMRGRAGVEALDRLAAKYTEDPNILRTLTWRRMTQGDYAGTLEAWRHLQRISRVDAARVADAEVRALIASNHGTDAAGLLTTLLNDPKDDSRAEHAAEYLMVVSLTGGDPRRQIERLGKAAEGDVRFDPIRVRAGMDPVANAAQQSPLVALMLALRSDPAAAMRLADKMATAEFSQLGPEQWGLLFAEAVRSDHPSVVAKLERFNAGTTYAERTTLKRFVKGEAVALDDISVEPGLRAAALLVRSRNPALPQSERATLRADAARMDLLHSVVSSALTKWPT